MDGLGVGWRPETYLQGRSWSPEQPALVIASLFPSRQLGHYRGSYVSDLFPLPYVIP